ncbi:MAG TPA: SPOR domain-containing protein [Thermoanaerobaculia bacterium]|nr:SPOR domain-containing protein [Thermoanaerobaculia bacterium]
MLHKMYVFRLHKNGVIAVAVGALLLAVLIFAGGWLVGVEHGVVLARRLTPPAEALAQVQAVGLQVPPAPAVAAPAVPAPAVPAPAVTAPAMTVPAVTAPAAPALASPAPAERTPEPEPVSPEAAPAESPPAPVAAAPAATLVPRAYCLQVAAFLVEDNAKAAVAELTERGFEPQVVRDRGSLDRTLYRVLVGRYATRAEAAAAARAFRREERQDAIVVEARVAPTSSG